MGFLREDGYVLIGVFKGSIINNEFIGYFISLSENEVVNVPNELAEGVFSGDIAYVNSPLPVFLRYLVFNEYFNGTLVNTLPMMAIKSGNPPLTIIMGNGNECNNYSISVTFLYPTRVVPIPIVINQKAPITLITTSITIERVSPSTILMLLEPGDVVYAQTPIYNATYTLTVCSEPSYYSNNVAKLYAIEYITPTDVSLINELRLTYINLSNIELINKIIKEFMNDGYKIGPTVPLSQFLISKTGSLIDFVTVVAYVLRYYGVPSRIVLGYYGVKEGNDTYVYSSSTATLWVESFTNSGWIAFLPAPRSNSLNYNQLVFYIILSLLLTTPWLIGYIIYLFLIRLIRRV